VSSLAALLDSVREEEIRQILRSITEVQTINERLKAEVKRLRTDLDNEIAAHGHDLRSMECAEAEVERQREQHTAYAASVAEEKRAVETQLADAAKRLEDAERQKKNFRILADSAKAHWLRAEDRIHKLEEALREIEKGEGAFSRDPLEHA
jgi:chromosome segregation ATPase